MRIFSFFTKRYFTNSLITISLLFLITILGFYLRFSNLSTFKVYPDSYQSLLVAENLAKYNSVVGFLGDDGMVFPQFAMWTRPFYPILINVFNFATKDSTISAQIIALLASTLTIPAIFFLIKNIFNSRLVAILASLLLAISYQHTLWSGFIMTESLGVLMMTLTLLLLFSNLKTPPKLADPKDLLTGALFGLAILTRYEYFSVAIPIVYIVLKVGKLPYIRLLNIFTSSFLILAIVLSQIFPVVEFFQVLTAQMQSYLLLVSTLIVLLIVAIFILKKSTLIRSEKMKNLLALTIYSLAVLLITQVLIPGFNFMRYELSAVRKFFTYDFILGITLIIGIKKLTEEKKYNHLLSFVIISIILFGFVYYRINPDMERYWTHLVPFLLIPASFGASYVFQILKRQDNIQKNLTFGFIIFLFTIQIVFTKNGLQQIDDSWYRQSYEEASAVRISKIVRDKDTILIVSFPEAYYYFTHLTTHSIADSPPYLYIDNSLDDKNVLIINDMGMRDVFANFSKFIEKNLKEYEILTYKTYEKYHYVDRVEDEKYPVTLYKIKLKDLKSLINKISKS